MRCVLFFVIFLFLFFFHHEKEKIDRGCNVMIIRDD
jgi:hypothetical protein